MESENGYAASLSVHPNAFAAAAECAGEVLERLDGNRPDLVVVFASEHHADAFADVTAGVRGLLEPDVLLGCTAAGVAGGGSEIEHEPAISIFAANWGGGRARPVGLDSFPFGAGEVETGLRITGWPDDLPAAGTLLLLADPANFPLRDFLSLVNERTPDLRVIGALASGTRRALALDDAVTFRGAVGVLLDQQVVVDTVVSQGCRPIGQPFTITRSERNIVYELAGRPALDRLREVVAGLDDHDSELIRRGLHVGIVVDEHRLDFERGDFLVRNLVGVDESGGALAIGEPVLTGQTVQFHVRDSASAADDLDELLSMASAGGWAGGPGALLFTCTGRGVNLFGRPDHDVTVIADHLRPAALAGMFCAGEIGPVGGRNFLHGYTASVAVFR